jgi:hypothetical protein
VAIRKLPSKDFNLERFTEELTQFLNTLNIKKSDVDILSFMEGKISRKRGPVPGASFLSIRDPAAFHCFTSALRADNGPAFLAGEPPDCQPSAEVAVYQRCVEREHRHDKLDNTIESSTDYKVR